MIEVSIEDKGLTTRLTAISGRADTPGSDVMGEIGKMLVASVRENFNQEGRPSQWVPSRSAIEQGRKTLTATGRLANSPAISEVSDRSIEVTTGGGLGNYPVFLSKGTGPQTVSDRQRKFFWAKFYETGLQSFKSMALSKVLKGLPARRFSLIQDADGKTISDKLRNFILTGETRIEIT